MSDKSSAYAALISGVSEKNRVKDVEQFDDILRTFTNQMNKFESRFGKIRDEEKMLAVRMLMPDKLAELQIQRNDDVKTGHIAAWCGKGGKKNLYAMDEVDSEDINECSNRSTKSEEDLQTWCILEESESEQWQEVISRRSRQRAKKNQSSVNVKRGEAAMA